MHTHTHTHTSLVISMMANHQRIHTHSLTHLHKSVVSQVPRFRGSPLPLLPPVQRYHVMLHSELPRYLPRPHGLFCALPPQPARWGSHRHRPYKIDVNGHTKMDKCKELPHCLMPLPPQLKAGIACTISRNSRQTPAAGEPATCRALCPPTTVYTRSSVIHIIQGTRAHPHLWSTVTATTLLNACRARYASATLSGPPEKPTTAQNEE